MVHLKDALHFQKCPPRCTLGSCLNSPLPRKKDTFRRKFFTLLRWLRSALSRAAHSGWVGLAGGLAASSHSPKVRQLACRPKREQMQAPSIFTFYISYSSECLMCHLEHGIVGAYGFICSVNVTCHFVACSAFPPGS